MLCAASSPSSASTLAALVDVVSPITRPPVTRAHADAYTATVCDLPVPAGETRTLISR